MVTVLVLTNSLDIPHVAAVRRHVEALDHKFLRIDVDRIIRGENQVIWNYQRGSVRVVSDDNDIELADVDSIWWRKPYGFGGTHGFAESIHDSVQRVALEKEIRDLIDGLSAVLSEKFWLNSPASITQARLKPYQLHVAKQVGMLVPETLITSDPETAKAFCAQGPTVFKPMAEPMLDYGEVSYAVETTLVNDYHRSRFDLIRRQPILLQRFIAKKHELRVTCVGDQIFVARQELSDAVSHSAIDWRPFQGTGDSSYRIDSLSPGVAASVRELLQRLDLGFAAMDFVIDGDDKCFFLEVNPNGQWLGYTDMVGLPAATVIARCLVEQTRHPNLPQSKGGD